MVCCLWLVVLPKIGEGEGGGFGGSVFGGDAEGPVLDLLAGGEPVVGEGEDEGADGLAGSCLRELAEELGLAALAVALGVEADFAEDEREGAGDVVEAGEILFKLGGIFEEEIEAAEIGAGGMEIFSGRIIGVGGEAVGGNLLHDVDELVDEALDAAAAVVADDVGGDFVGDAEGEGGGMIGDEAGRFGDAAARVGHGGGVIEKTAVFVPGDVDEEVQIVNVCLVEEPARGDVVEAK